MTAASEAFGLPLHKPCKETWTWPFVADHFFAEIRLPFQIVTACTKCGRNLESYADECEIEAVYKQYLFNLNYPPNVQNNRPKSA